MHPAPVVAGSSHLLVNIRDKQQQRSRRFAYKPTPQIVWAQDPAMSLTYKTRTTRQCDNDNWKTLDFYVAGYGALSVMHDQDIQKRPRSVRIHFNNERSTERMDVLWTPESDISTAVAQQYRCYLANLTPAILDELRHQLAGGCKAETMATPKPPLRNYHQALTKPGVKLAQGVRRVSKTPRHCNEHVFRVVFLRFLLENRLRDVYRVYAALSPFHERHVEEITALSNERTLPDDKVLTTEQVAIILNWLRTYEFAVVPAYVPLDPVSSSSSSPPIMPETVSLTPVDYDHGLGARVHHALRSLFTLAPGTELSDKDYMGKRRTEMRRSVHAYRQERTVEILRTTKDFIVADINATKNADVPQILKARGLGARRVLMEHDIISDVLHAHRLGARDGIAVAAATAAKGGGGGGGGGGAKPLGNTTGPNAAIDVPFKPALPLKIRRIIGSCSCLPEPPLQSSPRSDSEGDSDGEPGFVSVVKRPIGRLCNTWENYTRYEFVD